jgi:RND family efflux transporter MFP subunit
MKRLILALLLLVLFYGCAKERGEADHQDRPIRRTVWTEKSELFLEYTGRKAGQECTFLLHFTDLGTFKPVAEGPLVLTFTSTGSEPLTITVKGPAPPGIFKAQATFKNAGKYTLKAVIANKTFSDEILVDNLEITAVGDNPHEVPPPAGDRTLIAFSKEQQWRIEFKTEKPTRREVSSSFLSPGEFIPVSNSEVTISAPLAGILSVSKRLPYLGQKVERDQTVAQIEPAAFQQGGVGQLSAAYSEAKNRAILAQKEYDRAKRLYEAKAVPKRRLEEAEIALDTTQAALSPLERAMESTKKGTVEHKIMVPSPLQGTVVELLVSNGKAVEAGQPLMRVINTSTLWLRANVQATEIAKLKQFDEVFFAVSGVDGTFRPTRLVAVNEMVDPKSRTVPVVFEVPNPKGLFKVGMFADVSIVSGKAHNLPTLPEQALFEDEGRFFVYVQKEGEAFERREVAVGTRGGGYAHISGGIRDDERVVTRGGYYVKLASLSSRTQQGHGHEH